MPEEKGETMNKAEVNRAKKLGICLPVLIGITDPSATGAFHLSLGLCF